MSQRERERQRERVRERERDRERERERGEGRKDSQGRSAERKGKKECVALMGMRGFSRIPIRATHKELKKIGE